MRDADELGDLITNREEAMAAETMLTNGCIMKHIADDADKGDEMEIRFYPRAATPRPTPRRPSGTPPAARS